ncbi:MAG: SIS domain-containing protein [Lachnospiraceae bacterium]
MVHDYENAIAMLGSVFHEQKRREKNHIYFIGNGGSAAIAIHMTADFLKNGGLTTVGMYDAATLTCLGNDYGYEYVFSKQLEMLAQPGDLLVAISSSGNSQNIINAIEVAHEKGASVVTLTGFKPDNKVKQMGEYNLYVPCMEYGIVESIHNMILQQVVDEVMAINE